MSTQTINPEKINDSNLDTILQSVFNLTPQQFRYFKNLESLCHEMYDKSDGICIQMITAKLSSDRSSIQKVLTLLKDKGLIERKAITLADFNIYCKKYKQVQLQKKNEKGSLYLYKPISHEQLLVKLKQILQDWVQIIEKNQINK